MIQSNRNNADQKTADRSNDGQPVGVLQLDEKIVQQI